MSKRRGQVLAAILLVLLACLVTWVLVSVLQESNPAGRGHQFDGPPSNDPQPTLIHGTAGPGPVGGSK